MAKGAAASSMLHDRLKISWDKCRRDDALAYGASDDKGISFVEGHMLRVGRSPKIELQGMAQSHGGQFGSDCCDGTLTCSNFCVSRLC